MALSLFDGLGLFITARRAEQRAPRTIDYYNERLIPFARWCGTQGVVDCAQLTTNVVRAFQIHLSDEKHWTVNNVALSIRALRAFVRFLAEEEPSPLAAVVKVKVPHVTDIKRPTPSPEEFRALLAAISPKRQGAKAAARDRALLKVLASTGVRCAELCGLRWCDIDFDTNRVDVRAATAKGRRSRVVFLGAESKTAVVRWRQLCPTTDQDAKTDESPVFVGRRGQPLGVIGVQQVLRRLCDAAGIRPLRPHAWRRFFASQSLAAGMDVLRLQQLMGHRSLQMTQVYITITPAQLSQAVAEHGAVEFALRAK